MACSSPEQVRVAHENIMTSADRHGKANTVVLAQEFLDGDEYFVNTVSRDGRHHTVEIWRYYKIRLAGGNIIYDYDEPLAPNDPVAKSVERYTRQVLDALEIRNWATHTDVMVTADYAPSMSDLEPPVGFEPTTYALQVRCSGQTELRRHGGTGGRPSGP